MNSVERQLLDLTVEMNSHLTSIVKSLGERVADLEDRLDGSSGLLTSGFVNGAVGKMLISELFAELANGDRRRLDEILTNSTSLTETIVAQSAEEGAHQIQVVLDEVLEGAEHAFERRRLLK